MSAMRRDVVINRFANRLKQAGKPAKIVIVACMHKLNAMLRPPCPGIPMSLDIKLDGSKTLARSALPWNPHVA